MTLPDTATKHRVRISPGNIKMGRVDSVSLPPVTTCGRVPCVRVCYVVRNMLRGRYGTTISKSYAANLAFLTADIAGFLSAIEKHITRKQPDFFRYHVSGDFNSQEYFDGTVEVARRNPDTLFLAFTKQYQLLPAARTLPKNYAVVCSTWPGWKTPPAGYRRAWYQNGDETRVPGNALACPGNCETCGFCFNINKTKRDVVFNHH